MVQINNDEIGNLAKPRRVSFQDIIFVVALLMKGVTIHCKVRLEYEVLETYIISSRLVIVSLLDTPPLFDGFNEKHPKSGGVSFSNYLSRKIKS